MRLKNGYIVVVHEECPTCQMVVPVLAQIAEDEAPLTIYTQDKTAFLSPVPLVNETQIIKDSTLETSFRLDVETVPTLIKLEDGVETERIVGWRREEWETFTHITNLGPSLPEWKPGCGAKNVEPHIKDQLTVRYRETTLSSRVITLSDIEDEIEAGFERGWSDGFPLVPPTKIRVYRMLQGANRDPSEVIGQMPHNLAPVTVEKVAINAVMAGCKPEYFPVVLAAVEAASEPTYGLRAFMASTWFSAPVVVVNGPIAKKIGMASGFSAFGSGNRANATVGRALNLVIRNVGEVRPGEVARSTFGNPGRYSFCFAENEDETSWLPISTERGAPKGSSAVTLLSGDGIQPLADERSRTPESLTLSLAHGLKAVYHHKWSLDADVILAVSPEHSRIFEAAGWSKAMVRTALEKELIMNTAEMEMGKGGIMEGLPSETVQSHPTLPKFTPGGIHIIRVGSNAGLYSAIISCWPSGGDTGTAPVTKVIES